MKSTRITLDVVRPDEMQADEVAAALNSFLDVRLSDAQDTVVDEGLVRREAQLAVSLQFGPQLATVNPESQSPRRH